MQDRTTSAFDRAFEVSTVTVALVGVGDDPQLLPPLQMFGADLDWCSWRAESIERRSLAACCSWTECAERSLGQRMLCRRSVFLEKWNESGDKVADTLIIFGWDFLRIDNK